MEPFGEGSEPASREAAAPAGDDHGHHGRHLHDRESGWFSDHRMTLVTAVCSVIIAIVTLIRI